MSLSKVIASRTQVDRLRGNETNNNFVNTLQKAFAQMKFDTNYKKNFLIIGDSVVEGSGASNIENAYMSRFQKEIFNKFNSYEYLERIIYPYDTTSSSIVALTGSFSNVVNAYSTVDNSNITPDRGWCKTTTNGDVVTIATYGHLVRVLFASDGVFNGETAGSVDIRIDGGSPTTIDLSSSDKYKTVDIGNLTSATTITLTANLTTGENMAIQSIQFLKNYNGLNTINFATGSSTADNWADCLNVIDAFKPIASYVSLGGNDISQALSDESYDTNMRAILAKLKSYGDVIFGFYAIGTGFDSATLERVERFRIIARKLATEFDIVFIDFNDIFIDGETANAEGLLSDTVHPNDKGYFLMWEYFKNKLTL